MGILIMPKKLTPSQKQVILDLYRRTPETTSTLAQRYQVSNSTISRFLKNALSRDEYEHLIQKKRLARTQKPNSNSQQLLLPITPSTPSTTLDSSSKAQPLPSPILAQRTGDLSPTPELGEKKPHPPISPSSPTSDNDDDKDFDVVALGEMLGEDLEDSDDWDDDEDDNEPLEAQPPQSVRVDGELPIIPLSKAIFPKTCYLVINRQAELITKPLKKFKHLGNIPRNEVEQKTLPVFGNRVCARREAKRFQRVLKIPNGSLLLKTSSHLLAKGINYLLMDGCLYSLAT